MSTQTAVHHTEGLRDGVRLRQGLLSESVIPAVRGEYYAYSSEFTRERPLYALMKCKSNKSRPIEAVENLGREVNLLFQFWQNPHLTGVTIWAIKTAHERGMLGEGVNGESFLDIAIAPVEISASDFYDLRSTKNVQALVEACRTACTTPYASISLYAGDVIAMMTSDGKYGLFLVRELGSESIKVDACHILL